MRYRWVAVYALTLFWLMAGVYLWSFMQTGSGLDLRGFLLALVLGPVQLVCLFRYADSLESE